MTSLTLLTLTLFKMGLFGVAHGWGQKGSHLPKICHIYLAMMKRGTVMPYLKKIQIRYEPSDTPLEFC